MGVIGVRYLKYMAFPLIVPKFLRLKYAWKRVEKEGEEFQYHWFVGVDCENADEDACQYCLGKWWINGECGKLLFTKW